MTDLTRSLWLIAIAVRGIALLIATRKAPASWIVWAAFSEVFSIALRVCDYERLGTWYLRLWMIEQIGSVLLLAWLIWKSVDPPRSLVIACTAIAALFGAGLCTVRLFPNSPVEPVLIGCGLALLAMGAMALVIALATFRVDLYILTTYLLLSAFLMLSAPDYLKQAGLGQAWEIPEICAFTAWGAYYGFTSFRERNPDRSISAR